MTDKKITFKDLSTNLKIVIVYGWYALFMTIISIIITVLALVLEGV